MFHGIPFNTAFHFNDHLEEEPESPAEMTQAVAWVRQRIAAAVASQGERESVARLYGRMSVLLRMLRQLNEAEEASKRALSICEEIGSLAGTVANRLHLAQIYHWQGQKEKAAKIYQECLEKCLREPDLRTSFLDFALHQYGNYLYNQRKYEEALALFNQAWEMRMRDRFKKKNRQLLKGNLFAIQMATKARLKGIHV